MMNAKAIHSIEMRNRMAALWCFLVLVYCLSPFCRFGRLIIHFIIARCRDKSWVVIKGWPWLNRYNMLYITAPTMYANCEASLYWRQQCSAVHEKWIDQICMSRVRVRRFFLLLSASRSAFWIIGKCIRNLTSTPTTAALIKTLIVVKMRTYCAAGP